MNNQTLPPRFIKGLSNNNFSLEIDDDPELAQDINRQFLEKKTNIALKKLAELKQDTKIRISIPEEAHLPVQPSGNYGFEVGSEDDWKIPILTEATAYDYIYKIKSSPNNLAEVIQYALSNNAMQAEAARLALSILMEAKLASVIAIANRKQMIQVYGIDSASNMIPLEYIAPILISRRAFENSFNDDVKKYEDQLTESAFHETSQEITHGIGFRIAPTLQKNQDQITELQKSYIKAAWAYSSEYVGVLYANDYNRSEVKKLWKKASSILNQINDLQNPNINDNAKSIKEQSPILKQWKKTYIWSISIGAFALVLAIIFQVEPLINIADSKVLSIIITDFLLVATIPIVCLILDHLGFYSILILAVAVGSLWILIDMIAGTRSIEDQTTWVLLMFIPISIIYETFRDKVKQDILLEKWLDGVV